MVSILATSRPELVAGPAGLPGVVGLAVCPLCQTAHVSLTTVDVSAGADWECSQCGARWDARRLATVTAYSAWVEAHIGPVAHGGVAKR